MPTTSTISNQAAKQLVYTVTVEVRFDVSDAAPVDFTALNDVVTGHQAAIGQAISEAAVSPSHHTDVDCSFTVSSGGTATVEVSDE